MTCLCQLLTNFFESQEPVAEDYLRCTMKFKGNYYASDSFYSLTYSCKRFLVFLLYNARINFTCAVVSTTESILLVMVS
jgi:hypothetical protein